MNAPVYLRRFSLVRSGWDELAMIVIMTISAGLWAGAEEVDSSFFESRIRPVLAERCYECHSGEAHSRGKLGAGLLLDNWEGLLAGGESGPGVVPGKPEESEIVKALRHESVAMPKRGKPLTQEQINDFVHWIEGGAPHILAGQVKPPPDLESGRKHWAFQRLRPVEPPQVDDPRVINDIDRFILAKQRESGVASGPPAPSRVLLRRAAFDLTGLPPDPELAELSYEKALERLLDDPAYGERWALHWLDIARYAESNGYEKDPPRESAYHYRDFVIEALNADMPYDRFVRLQIAGDLLEPDNATSQVAPAFLVSGVYNTTADGSELEQHRYDLLDDMISTVSTAMLGLNMNCARCHDHMFDPIREDDYYRFAAAFANVGSGELKLSLPGTVGKDAKVEVYTAVEGGQAYRVKQREVYHLVRGNTNRKTKQAQFAPLPVLNERTTVGDQHPRVEVAEWLTDTDRGAGHLLARVIVNRLWHHHFGRGIVSTPSDFGNQGNPPSHPELLDWLAGEFLRNGARLKPMHRMIMESATYRQSSVLQSDNAQIDPGNTYLWRYPVRRHDAQVIRDSLLSVAGMLERRLYGAIPDKDQGYRRSIYLTRKRNRPDPFLSEFDMPEAFPGVGSRRVSTSGSQALSVLNGPLVLACAEQFAGNLLKSGSSDADRVDKAYRAAFFRSPTEEELSASLAFLERQRTTYSDKDAQLAALTDFCQALLCSNEFFHVH